MDSDELTERLAELKQRRGYLLPHHGLMAVTMPDVMEAYDVLYGRLALSSRGLSEHDHELIWLAILAAREERLATHHVARFVAAGGTAAQVAETAALAAALRSSAVWQFVAAWWEPHVDDLDARRAFFEAQVRLTPSLDGRRRHLAAVAALTCCGHWDVLRWQLVAAYEQSLDEHDIAHALALTMFPGSVPNFVQAARVWHELIDSGEVDASPDFRAWAELAGQGGYDEASGKRG